MFVITGTPCGVVGSVVAMSLRVGLQVLVVLKPRGSVVLKTLPTASNATFAVKFVGAMVLVSSRRLVYWKLVTNERALVRLNTSPGRCSATLRCRGSPDK